MCPSSETEKQTGEAGHAGGAERRVSMAYWDWEESFKKEEEKIGNKKPKDFAPVMFV